MSALTIKHQSKAKRKFQQDVVATLTSVRTGPLIVPPVTTNKKKHVIKMPESVSLKRVDYTRFMFSVDHFMTVEECQSWVKYGQTKRDEFEHKRQVENRNFAHREVDELEFYDEDISERMFERIVQLLPSSLQTLDGKVPIACSSRIRLYQYRVGHWFGGHVDVSTEETIPETKGGGMERSLCTVLIYLGNGHDDNNNMDSQEMEGKTKTTKKLQCSCTGGETVFYNSHLAYSKKRPDMYANALAIIKPITGRIVVHGHGDRCMTHASAEIMKGVKNVLRTDIIYK